MDSVVLHEALHNTKFASAITVIWNKRVSSVPALARESSCHTLLDDLEQTSPGYAVDRRGRGTPFDANQQGEGLPYRFRKHPIPASRV